MRLFSMRSFVNQLSVLRLVVVCAALLVAALAAPLASANGAPVTIYLNYLPGQSNTGPQDASGVAVVSIGEGTVNLTAEGLPRLSGKQYEVWLMRADNEQMVSLGTFNAAEDGSVEFRNEVESIPDVGYRYLLLTIEPDPDSRRAASAERSIAGVFPNPAIQITDGATTATPAPGVTPGPGAPETLPTTGGAALPSSPLWAALPLALALVALFALLRPRARG